MKIAKENSWLLAMLSASFLGFVALSWWLLFRDERALSGIQDFYPQLSNLFAIRTRLLGLGLNVIPTFLFAGLALLSFGAYFLSLKAKFTVWQSLIWAIIFQVIVFFSYPILSTDIFSYIFSDRVFSEYGQNIWKVVPLTYASDQFEQLADWKDQTKVYGALNQILYLPGAYMGQDDLMTTVVLYKLVPLLASFATMWVILKLTEADGPKRQAIVTRFLFWNPLYVLEIAGAAHNDILMILFLLLTWWAWEKKKWFMTGIFLALSVQIKLISVVFLGFAGLWLLQQKKWAEVTKLTASFLAINALAFAYMAVSPLEFLSRVLYNTSVYWQSLPSLVHRFWDGEKGIFTLALGFMILSLIYYQLRHKVSPLWSAGVALTGYLLFFAAAYWNWYVLWIFFLLPFIKSKNLAIVILTLTFTSLLAYPLLWLSLRFNYQHWFWALTTYIWVFGVPLAAGYLYLKKPKLFSFLD